MRQILVYDVPTRIFHWLFAGFFITAFAISNLVDDESARFSLHMLAGLGMVFVVLLRLAWSVVGTRHARVTDLALRPGLLLAYVRGLFSAQGRRWPGHNPASSWAAVAMVGLALGLGATGYLMATGAESHALKEVHEVLANTFLVVVLLHLAGIVLHVLKHRDRLPAAMVTGRKEALDEAQEAVRGVPAAGLAFLACTALFIAYLLQHYDAQARTLDLFGSTLQLGENEQGIEAHARPQDEDDD
jgi:cytochrome b